MRPSPIPLPSSKSPGQKRQQAPHLFRAEKFRRELRRASRRQDGQPVVREVDQRVLESGVAGEHVRKAGRRVEADPVERRRAAVAHAQDARAFVRQCRRERIAQQ